ncbi:MAG TPA: YfhO family protein [Chitinophagaceae bacterium]|nr:YfhO family protein [Chitinophagaceae bacterium]
MSKKFKQSQSKSKPSSPKIQESKNKGFKTPIKKNKNIAEAFAAFNTYFNKYGFYILLFLLVTTALFIFKDFIFFKKLYLFKDIGSDSVNANYPHGYQVAYYMKHVNLIPKWSFYQGMGQNIFPLSITDPYYFILTLLGANNLAYGIGIMEVSKMISAGVLFYLFLRKINLSPFVAVVGAICYSFSSFIVLGSGWNIFSTEAVYLALLLYAFEKLFQDNKIILFPIAIALIAINQPFDLFPVSIFLFIYILFRYYLVHSFNIKRLGLLLAKVAGLGVLGILLSSFFLFADILQMLESPRVGGESSYFSRLLSAPIFGFGDKLHNVTAVMRFFSSDALGTGSDFKGWYNYLEAPLFYFGLINLLLVPQVFHFLDKRKKIIYSIFISLFLLPVIFPFFRYGFWLFTGDYYRIFSLLVVIGLLICSLNALQFIDKEFRVSFLTLAATLILLLIILFYHYFDDQDIISENIQTKATIFLILYSILIALLRFRSAKNVSKTLIAILVCVEMIVFSDITINSRPVVTGEEFKSKINYNDYTKDAVNYLKANDKSFYRIHKEYSSGPAIHRSVNDAQVQNFYGTPSYYSFNQIYYIRFLGELEMIDAKDEVQTRWAPGLIGAPFLHPFASIKYALTKDNKSPLLQGNYDSLTKIGDIIILKNRYALPFGFTYEKYISQSAFHKLSNSQKLITLFRAVVLEDSVIHNTAMSAFNLNDTSLNYTGTDYVNDISALKKDSFNIQLFSENLIKGKIKADNKKILFFSIPFDKGWTIKLDSKEIKPFVANIGFTGIQIDKGEHTVELSFLPRFYNSGALISCIGLFLFLILIIIKYLFDRKKIFIKGENLSPTG